MKVMLMKDVYKLGRAGDVKKVADGFGRNFLLPQGLAVLATPGALKQVERIRAQAEIRRTAQNEELKGLADEIAGVVLTFAAKAGETDKLYGSITTQNVADALQEKTRYEVKRHQLDMQPIRSLGVFTAAIRLTMDLVPEIKIIVHREGEAVEDVAQAEQPAAEDAPISEVAVEEAVAEEVVVAEEAPAAEVVAEETLVAEEPVAEEEPAAEETITEEVPAEKETSVSEGEEAVADEASESDKE